MIKQFSEKVARGEQIDIRIPRVGRFRIRNNIAGVIFDQNLIASTYGKTAIGYQHLFSKTNLCNNQMHQRNNANYGALQTAHTEYANPVPVFKVSSDAKHWLKSNLDIECDFEPQILKSRTPAVSKGRLSRLRSSTRPVSK